LADKSLVKPVKNLSVIFSLILIFLFSAQNCSDSGQVSFSSPSKPNLDSAASGGLDGFDGKPLPGDYLRTYPNYSCTNSPKGDLGIQGFLNSKDSLNVTHDNCYDTNYTFLFDDKLVEFNSYNLDYLGIGTASYERVGSTLNDENPIVDVWCQSNSDTFGFDFIIKSDHLVKNSQSKIYFGSRPTRDSQWVSRTVAPSPVSRIETSNKITFQSASVFLEVNKSADSSILATGAGTANVDGVQYSLNNFSCRLANLKPIEEMGTSLTQPGSLTNLVLDSQESVCNQPGVLACENFENRTPAPYPADASNYPAKFKLGGFPFSNVNTASLINGNNIVDGTKAQSWFMDVDKNTTGSGGFSFGSRSEVFVRYYMKFSSNFVFSNNLVSTTHITGGNTLMSIAFNSNKNPGYWITRSDNQSQNVFFSSTETLQNPDQWHCVEMRVKSDTPTTGIIEIWIDNVKVVARNDLDIHDPALSDFGVYFNWNCNSGTVAANGDCLDSSDPLNHHPAQTMYLDNMVAARQRIGCF
jgi:hypothetical protein